MNAETKQSFVQPAAAVAMVVMLSFGLLVVYVLGIGPASAYYTALDPSTQSAVEIFYAPLIWLDENSEACSDFFQWYCGLWA